MGASGSLLTLPAIEGRLWLCNSCNRVFSAAPLTAEESRNCLHCGSHATQQIQAHTGVSIPPPADDSELENRAPLQSRAIVFATSARGFDPADALRLRMQNIILLQHLLRWSALLSQASSQIENSTTPASAEAIAKLPRIELSKEDISELGDCCAICTEDFKTTESVFRLHCDHYFHASCVLEWFKVANTCPICREQLQECSHTEPHSSEESLPSIQAVETVSTSDSEDVEVVEVLSAPEEPLAEMIIGSGGVARFVPRASAPEGHS